MCFNKVFKKLREDEELYYAWQSNIAMAFYDEMQKHKRRPSRVDLLKTANDGAKRFLDLLIVKK